MRPFDGTGMTWLDHRQNASLASLQLCTALGPFNEAMLK